MGGLWAFVLANSPQDVTIKYPWLKTFETRPQWMSEREQQSIAATNTFDIDDEPQGWFLTAAMEHGYRKP